MARHIVARSTDIPPGGNKVVTLEGRDVVVFHANGEFFALLNRCPHAGAPLDQSVNRQDIPEPQRKEQVRRPHTRAKPIEGPEDRDQQKSEPTLRRKNWDG